MKRLSRELIDTQTPTHADLGKFDHNDFATHENALLNLFAHSYGVLRDPLGHVVCQGFATIKSFVNRFSWMGMD
jgi:hypothetical protein